MEPAQQRKKGQAVSIQRVPHAVRTSGGRYLTRRNQTCLGRYQSIIRFHWQESWPTGSPEPKPCVRTLQSWTGPTRPFIEQTRGIMRRRTAAAACEALVCCLACLGAAAAAEAPALVLPYGADLEALPRASTVQGGSDWPTNISITLVDAEAQVGCLPACCTAQPAALLNKETSSCDGGGGSNRRNSSPPQACRPCHAWLLPPRRRSRGRRGARRP